MSSLPNGKRANQAPSPDRKPRRQSSQKMSRKGPWEERSPGRRCGRESGGLEEGRGVYEDPI